MILIKFKFGLQLTCSDFPLMIRLQLCFTRHAMNGHALGLRSEL